MTLVLTITRPGEGAWMCSDRMLSKFGNPLPQEADKVVALQCSDGPLLLGFAGLGEIDRVTKTISAWALETCRGQNRTIERTIIHLTQRLNRDVYHAWRHHPLTIIGVAFVGIGGGWFAPSLPLRAGEPWLYQITNSILSPERQLIVQDTFEAQKKMFDQPVFALFGGGAALLLPAELHRVQEIALRRPRQPEDLLGLLAKLIRTASDRDTKRKYGVGPWTRGCYIPATGGPFVWKSYRGPGRRQYLEESVPPEALFGVDLAEIVRGFKESTTAYWNDQISPEETDRRIERTLRRSVEGRP